MEDTHSANKIKIAAALVSLYIFWSLTYLAIKFAINQIPPFMMSGLRYFLTGIGLLLFLRLKGNALPDIRKTAAAAIIGVLLLLGGNGGVAYAIQTVSTGVSAMMVASVPLWTVIFAGFWKKWPNRIETAGLLIGFCGIIFLNINSELSATPQGTVVLVIAAASWAFGSAWGRNMRLPDGLMSSAIQMSAGGLAMLVVSLASGEKIYAMPGLKAVTALLYLMIFGSLVGFSCYTFLIKNVKPSLATSYAYVNPALAVAAGVLFAGEKVTSTGVVSMGIIIAGVILVIAGSRERKNSK